jgi:hypothetical protein
MTPLADFARPPVVEVALTVQLEPNTLGPVMIVGYAADAAESGFSEIQLQPPLDRLSEPFPPQPAQLQVEIVDTPPMPRFWFMEPSGEKLLQLQHDRVGLNWRKLDQSARYPRYPKLRSLLRKHLERLEARIGDEMVGQMCEVTYINHVDAKRTPRLGDVTPLAGRRRKRDFLPDPEAMQLAARFVVQDDTSESPLGRLHFAVGPALRMTDAASITMVTLTARLRVTRTGVDGIIRSMDLGREWVVRGFVDLTSSAMHDAWGLQED